MSIRVKLAARMEEQGLSLTQLQGKVGLTLANLSILKNNRARAIRFSTLEALCRELHCQPGELLEWETTPKGEEQRGSSAGLPGDYY